MKYFKNICLLLLVLICNQSPATAESSFEELMVIVSHDDPQSTFDTLGQALRESPNTLEPRYSVSQVAKLKLEMGRAANAIFNLKGHPDYLVEALELFKAAATATHDDWTPALKDEDLLTSIDGLKITNQIFPATLALLKSESPDQLLARGLKDVSSTLRYGETFDAQSNALLIQESLTTQWNLTVTEISNIFKRNLETQTILSSQDLDRINQLAFRAIDFSTTKAQEKTLRDWINIRRQEIEASIAASHVRQFNPSTTLSNGQDETLSSQVDPSNQSVLNAVQIASEALHTIIPSPISRFLLMTSDVSTSANICL